MVDVASIDQILQEWFNSKKPSNVKFENGVNPVADMREDYHVQFEAKFTPRSLEKAAIEIWVTTEGDVAIGFERRKRVEERLGLTSYRDRFASGHEPISMDESELMSLMDLAADGKLAISTRILPVVGLVSTRAIVCGHELSACKLQDYLSRTRWLKIVSHEEFEQCDLRYRNWACTD